MVINVDATGRPMRQDVAGGGQGLQCRAVEPRIARASADPELLHRTVVELVEQRPDRAIQGVETEEGLMAQPGENPPLGEEDAVFDRGLVAGLPRAGRDHHGPVVRRQLLIRSIDARLVAAGPRDGALQLVGDPEGGRAPEVFDHPGVGADPVGHLLGRRRLGVGVAARAEDGDEQIDRSLLTGVPIDDRRPLAQSMKVFSPTRCSMDGRRRRLHR